MNILKAIAVSGLIFIGQSNVSANAANSITINWDNDGPRTVSRASPVTCLGATCSSPSSISSGSTGTITATITSSVSTLLIYRYTAFSGGDTVGCRATLRVSQSGGSCSIASDSMLASDGGLGNIPTCSGSGTASITPACDVTWNIGMDF